MTRCTTVGPRVVEIPLRAKLTLLVPVVKAEFPSGAELNNQTRDETSPFIELDQLLNRAFILYVWTKPHKKTRGQNRFPSR